MKTLTIKDIIILGLLNFALYVGAGNIIFPPYIGMMAGGHVWISALGFFLTGVGLPVLTAIAMGRMEGSITKLAAPVGAKIAVLLIVICYLCAGPLGAIPRAATVAHDLAILPFIKKSDSISTLYYISFFILVTAAALNPTKIFQIVGKFLTPIKVLALILLCITVFMVPLVHIGEPQGPYLNTPFSEGLVQGYLTMDTFASLIFGVILVNAIRSRGVTSKALTLRYVVFSAIISGCCLMMIYLCLFRLGRLSANIAEGSTNGAQVLSAYIAYHFGLAGKILVSFLITIACLVASIGVGSSFAFYFSELTGLSYRFYVLLSSIVSTFVANLGLTRLIGMSVPILQAIYPVFIILIILSFFQKRMVTPLLISLPACILGLFFGIADALKTVNISVPFFDGLREFPFGQYGLAWIIPCFTLVIFCWIIDRIVLTRKTIKA